MRAGCGRRLLRGDRACVTLRRAPTSPSAGRDPARTSQGAGGDSQSSVEEHQAGRYGRPSRLAGHTRRWHPWWYPRVCAPLPPRRCQPASQSATSHPPATFAGTGNSHLPTFPYILWPTHKTHKPTPELRLPLAATCQVQPPPGSPSTLQPFKVFAMWRGHGAYSVSRLRPTKGMVGRTRTCVQRGTQLRGDCEVDSAGGFG